MTLLALENLTVEISNTCVCQDLSLEINPGEVWSVLGRNGVGKSTLLKTLAGLRNPVSGQILLDIQEVMGLSRRSRAQRLGILFQENETLFPASVLDTVLTGRHPWLNPLQGESTEDIQKAQKALDLVDLDQMSDRSMTSLSGGERRRADLAALVTQEPLVLLLDEPSNHLDMHYQVVMLGNLIADWRSRNGVVILVMHDINLALRFSDHLLLLFGEGLAESGPVETLATEAILSRVYNHTMRMVSTADGTWFYPG